MKTSTILLSALLVIFGSSLLAEEPSNAKIAVLPGDTIYDYGQTPMRYLENDRIKVGLDLSLGGAVTYVEDKANNSGNMINSYDWGRQIQLSYYSGPTPFIGPNGEEPSPGWAGLGWNPIQSGDYGQYRSQVLKFEQKDLTEIFLQTRPMLWPHTGVPAECLFECRYQLTKNGFILDATIINNRTDKTQYPGRSQETPALYTNAPWYKLVSYLGDKPFENEPVTVLVDKNDGKGWPWLGYYTPENWSALVNEQNYGIGIYQPFSTYASSGFHGGDEPKGQDLGAKSTATGYIAPREVTILDWNLKRTYRATFIVGSLEEIRNTVYELAQQDRKRTPSWVFNTDRQNWSYVNTTDEGYPIVDSLKINLSSTVSARAKSPDVFWKTEDASLLKIDCALFNEVSNSDVDDIITVCLTPVSPADSVDYLEWSEGSKNREQDRLEKEKLFPRLPQIFINVPVKFDGNRRTIEVDLKSHENYVGAMKSVEIIFPQRNGKAQVHSVFFEK